MSYAVVPDGSGWKVTKNGRTVSNHRKKRPAMNKAKQKASSGEQLRIYGANGAMQDVRTVR